MASLEGHASEWEALAVEQERHAELGLVLPKIAADRAEVYRRTAEALRIEERTGVAVCVCCHKPLGRGIRVFG